MKSKVNNSIILPDSDEAAHFGQAEGWISRHGRFYGNGPNAEYAARHDGATHRKCPDCGQVIKKAAACCLHCAMRYDRERWGKMSEVAWDGETPIYVFPEYETILFDTGEVEDYCIETETNPEDLMLVLAEKGKLPGMKDHVMDWILDKLPEDYDWIDIPLPIRQAIVDLDSAIEAHSPELWQPSNKRVTIYMLEVEV